ncbi:DUF1295 domain-containing protein [Calidifontibacter sp. DB0510]|uniref:DUF1295 domain-containing protein n=1 Tax=Metallococcus carri TaxID=1656884 RepID=A0A967B3E6_9MICO|nr:DUF1295 domain-containing protein [Metallococcus carri]NHN56803.1 DUF1295 domain-containing protein [Metallococcus carri]NOP37820.1 DUF1295 domain-containing protein [Calidifontibacter sp. DB2511S]
MPRGFGAVTAAAAAAVTALQAGTYAASRVTGRANVVDVVWGPGLAAVSWCGLALGRGDRTRRALLAAGTTAWGARLAWHVVRASRGRGEDPRYAELLDGLSERERIVKVFVTQGFAQWFISLPIQVAAVSGPPRGRRGALTGVGAALMLGGGVVEALADEQKMRWRRRADHGPVMDEGLWAWSRHPNYFGDACFWSGVYGVAAAAKPGAWTWPSPLAMTYFLVIATGARRAERMRAGDPAYDDYRRRVSFFVPLPPRRG